MTRAFWCRHIVAIALAGCGSVHGAATTPDGGGDDVDGHPATTLVTLTVLSTSFDGLPDTGAIAVFADPSGVSLGDGLVDGAGHAQAMMPDGGSVTVIRVNDVSDTERDVAMTTITGVKPGDELTVGAVASPRAFPGAATMLPVSFTSFASNYAYAFYTSCGGIGGSVTGTAGTAQLPMYDACHGATFDLVSVATSNDGTDVRYVYQPGLTYAPAGTITVPNTWTEANSFTATLTNVPVNLQSIVLTRSAMLGESAVAPMYGEIDSPGSGVVSVTAAMVPGLGTRNEIELGLHSQNASGFQIGDVRTTGAAATQGIDLAQQALPFIAGAPVETATTVSWDQLDTGTPDARLVSWAGHWPDGARTDFINWTIEDAGAGTSITLPALPAAYSQFDPSHANGLVLGHASVEYIDVDRLQGYDDARPFGPNLDAPIDDLGLFVDMPLVRRLSRTALLL